MGSDRRLWRRYDNYFLIAITATFVFAANLEAGQIIMSDRTKVIEQNLKLPDFRATLERPLRFVLSDADAAALFEGYGVTSLRNSTDEIAIVLQKDPSDYASLEAYLLPETASVQEAIRSPFLRISGPIKGVTRIESGEFEILAGLTSEGDFIAGARGRVVIRAKGPAGRSVVPLAEALMKHIYRVK